MIKILMNDNDVKKKSCEYSMMLNKVTHKLKLS